MEEENSKVVGYNMKKENIEKVKDIALKKFEGNKSKALNMIVEEYKE